MLTILPEMLRDFADYRMLIYAVLLIGMMLVTNTPSMKIFFSSLKGLFRKKDLQEAIQAAQGGRKGDG